MLIPLHLPSHWSIGHGVGSVAEIAARGAKWGFPSMALTDLENLSGAVEFHHACRALGIRPVLGVELRRGFLSGGRHSSLGLRRGRLVLLAREPSGYRSLCRIVSRRRTQGIRATGDPIPDVLADPDGLVTLTDDPGAAARLLGAGFPARFVRLLLIRPTPVHAERIVLDASRRLGLPLVADLDPVGLDPEDADLLRLQRAIRLGTPVRSTFVPRYRMLLHPGRARTLFADFPEAVAEAARVASECSIDVLPSGACCPSVDLAPGHSPAASLRAVARAALGRARAAGRLRGPAYDDRLARELSAIEALGLSSWFLALDAIASFARERRIQILGRGSAVGSLVVHLLGIGPVDPLEQGLLFERFLRPGRISPFDVDLDLPSRRREEVIDWVLGRWGPCAALIGAHQRFGPRSAQRGAEAALGPGERIADRLRERLIGCPRGLSVHPGGVVLAGMPIQDVVPLETAPKGIAATQFDGRSLDALGIVKLDFLGNTCLDEIDRAIELVRRANGGHPLTEDGPAAIPPADRATLRRLGAADTIGCSQIETPATRASLRRRAIRSIDDVTAALASVRPGPSSDGGPLFEEDVMRLLSLDGMVAMEEADDWRSAIVGTGGDADALAALGRRYVAVALARGASRERARRAWSKAVPFASYAFSKAHAASYALLAYRAAFLRTHYPLQWGCAVLDAHGGAYLERTIAAEVARWGIAVRPPAINASGRATRIREGRELLLGLDRIRGVSARTKASLLGQRETGGPFRSLADLVRRVRPSLREMEALVLSGTCDALDPLSAAGYPFLHEAVVAGLRSGMDVESIRLPSWRIAPEPGPGAVDAVARYRALVRARNELRYLGAAPTGHPLGILRRRSERDGCRTIADVLGEGETEVTIAALPAATRRVETARGAMRYVTWEDETGLLESRIRPAVLPGLAGRFRAGDAFRVSGRLEYRGAVLRLEVHALAPLARGGPGR